MNCINRFLQFLKQTFNYNIEIGYHLLSDEYRLIPDKAHEDDSGYDIRSASKKTIVIKPGETTLVPCGFTMELPQGYEAQIRPRSGLASKHSITVLNSPGTIDAGYRGEIKVILTNFGNEVFRIKFGDRIAQMVIMKLPKVSLSQRAYISDTKRSDKGFGSTGVE